jgi:ADP-ribosyl-[dinitrogen reductase] hydrolase
LSLQFRGCLLGLAVGDAIGAAALRLSPAELRREHGLLRDIIGGGRLHVRAGQGTEATETMQCVLDSYNVRGAFDPHEIADCLVDLLKSPRITPGVMTAAACRLLSEGYNFERAAQLALPHIKPEWALLGECLPRVVPAGLLHYHDDLHLIGESRVICAMTHPLELCKMTCTAFNLALQHMLLVGTGGLLEELIVFIEPRNGELAEWLKRVPGLRPERLDTSGHVAGVLQTALWAALFCTEFEEGVLLVINRGGEASLLGAMAGALLGARFGLEAIPQRWLDQLEVGSGLDRAAQRMFSLSQRDSLPEPLAQK